MMINNENNDEERFSKKSYFKRVENEEEIKKSGESKDSNDDIRDILKNIIGGLDDADVVENEDGSRSVIISTTTTSFDDDDHECPIFELYHQKILGITWNEDKLERFLKSRGYTISEITVDGETYKHGTKEGVNTADFDLYEIFENEIQDIILDWLLRLGK